MGPKLSRLDIESDSVRADRRSRSSILHQKRSLSKSTATAMLARVLAKRGEVGEHSHWDLRDWDARVLVLLIKFLAPELPTLMLVSASWYVKILEALDQAFARVESSFALIHSNLLFFKSSYPAHSIIHVSDRLGVRHDRVLLFEPLSQLCRQTVKLRCTYRFLSSPISYRYEYKFDCIPSGKRTVWVCKDDGKSAGKGFTAQIPKVCVGQTVEIAVNWFNLQGLVDLDSIEWQPPVIQDTEAVVRGLNAAVNGRARPLKSDSESEAALHRLFHYNISRHCEVEYANTEWSDAEYFEKQREVYIFDHFMPFLQLMRCEFGGVDVITSRNTYIAVCAGIVPDSKAKIGIEIEVKPQTAPLTSEVKRLGLLYDRSRPLELRVGDTFILYISKGG